MLELYQRSKGGKQLLLQMTQARESDSKEKRVSRLVSVGCFVAASVLLIISLIQTSRASSDRSHSWLEFSGEQVSVAQLFGHVGPAADFLASTDESEVGLRTPN